MGRKKRTWPIGKGADEMTSTDDEVNDGFAKRLDGKSNISNTVSHQVFKTNGIKLNLHLRHGGEIS